MPKPPTPDAASRLQAIVDRAWAGQHAQAADLSSEALAAPRLNAAHKIELLGHRAASRLALSAVDEALADAGQPERAGAALGNLAMAYATIGLYARARNPGGPLARMERLDPRRRPSAYFAIMQSEIESHLGHRERAGLFADQAAASADEIDDPWFAVLQQLVLGRAARMHDEWPQARQHFEAAAALAEARRDTTLQVVTLTELGRLRFETGDAAAALAATRRALAHLRARGDAGLGSMFTPASVWWWHARALQAGGQDAQARRARSRGYRTMLDGVATLGDEGPRRSWFNKVEAHRALILARQAESRPLTHLRSRTQLREPFERLVDAGVRLNQLHSAAALHEFLVEEATELSGAERVLLALVHGDALVLAGAQLPLGETAAPLLQAITPWLIEARHTRLASLRHGPEGAGPAGQRSCLIAPLVAQQQVLGLLYADIDGVFGRFDDADRDLLAMLAAQAAVALAKIHASEGLEAKVAERSAEAQAARERAEQRAGELAVVNGIQQGMTANLSLQAIVEVVGERLRELFKSDDIAITLLDDTTQQRYSVYAVERDQRLRIAPFPVASQARIVAELMRGRPVLVKNRAAAQAYRPRTLPGTVPATSVFVPVQAGNALHLAIRLLSLEREDAFDAATVRMLGTVAASMRLALQNARLVAETQEALQRQTASHDILKVMAASPGDVQPVFDAIVADAQRLTGATTCHANCVDGDWRPLAGTAQERAIRERRVVRTDSAIASCWPRTTS